MADVRRTHNLRQNAHRLDAGLKTALKQGGLVIAQRAQELAPEDTGRMTRAVSVSEPRLERGRMTVRIGPAGIEYAKYTELPKYVGGGLSSVAYALTGGLVGRRRKHLGPVSEAKGATMPWLRPALREKKGEAAEIIRASLAASLRAIARST